MSRAAAQMSQQRFLVLYRHVQFLQNWFAVPTHCRSASICSPDIEKDNWWLWISRYGLVGTFRVLERELTQFRVAYPTGGVRPFHRKSTCLLQFTSKPNVAQSWSRHTPYSGVNETLELPPSGRRNYTQELGVGSFRMNPF